MAFRVAICINFMSAKGRPAGWSNTFYHSGSDLGVAHTDTTELADRIYRLMGDQAVPIFARYAALGVGDNQIVTGKRNTTIRRFLFQPPGSTTGTPGATPEKALLMRDHAGAAYSRTWWLNGIWDSQEVTGGDFVASGLFGGYLTALVNTLAGGDSPWRLRTQDDTVQRHVISAATEAGVFTTVTPHGFQPGNWVHVVNARYTYRTPQSLRINGRRRVISVTDNTFTVNNANALVLDTTWDGVAEAYLEKQILSNYSSPGQGLAAVQVVRGGSHAVGRPFDAPTGHR